jgi:hypothetical protein
MLSHNQASTESDNAGQHFVVDSSKPYVYLDFQRLSPRHPLRAGELPTGVWLRLRNNCRVPIIVSSLGSSSEDGEYTLVDEVVSEPAVPDAPVVVDLTKPTLESSNGTPASPYDDEIRTAIKIPPGAALNFSIPLNQVGPTWHVEIPFRFDLKGWKGRQPKNAVVFYLSDIPKKP